MRKTTLISGERERERERERVAPASFVLSAAQPYLPSLLHLASLSLFALIGVLRGKRARESEGVFIPGKKKERAREKLRSYQKSTCTHQRGRERGNLVDKVAKA